MTLVEPLLLVLLTHAQASPAALPAAPPEGHGDRPLGVKPAGAADPAPTGTPAGPPSALADPAAPVPFPVPGAGATPPEPHPKLTREEARRILTPPKGSLSLGTTNAGTLARSVPLPFQGPGYRVLDVVPSRGTNYGTREMVDLIRRTGATLREAHPGAIVGVGNISPQNGGPSQWHASHQAGRDVDLAFFARDAAGRPVNPRQMTRFGHGGKAPSGGPSLTFDTPRNVALVRALLEDPEARVQWIFAAEWLESLLLEEGRRQGLPDELLARMEAVLRQPGGSSAHDDHFHVRIHCSVEDRLHGCLDWGPMREWVDHGEEPFAARCADLVRVVESDGSEMQAHRIEALDALAAIRGRPALPSLVAWLDAPEVKIRKGSLRAIRLINDPAAIPGLVGALSRIRDRAFAASVFDAVRLLPDPTTREVAMALAAEPASFLHPEVARGDLSPFHLTIAKILERHGEKEAVPTLLALLESPSRDVRKAAGSALVRVTAHTVAGDPTSAKETLRKKASDAWRTFWETRREEPWNEWLRRGIAAAGYAIEGRVDEPPAIEALIEATRDRRLHVAHNAVRLLSRVTGHDVDPTWRSPAQNHAHWRSWWRGVRAAHAARAIVPSATSAEVHTSVP